MLYFIGALFLLAIVCAVVCLRIIWKGEAGKKRRAVYWAAGAILFGLIAVGIWMYLVTSSKVPVYDGGKVTTISQTFADKSDAAIYTIQIGGQTYLCEDGLIKCTDIKLGNTVIGQRWAPDGTTWKFKPLGVVQK